MSGPYKPTQREYAMENLNTQMDDQLKNRVAELNRANDENRDGRLDAADLKAYGDALAEDDGTTYSMEEAMRMAMMSE